MVYISLQVAADHELVGFVNAHATCFAKRAVDHLATVRILVLVFCPAIQEPFLDEPHVVVAQAVFILPALQQLRVSLRIRPIQSSTLLGRLEHQLA